MSQLYTNLIWHDSIYVTTNSSDHVGYYRFMLIHVYSQKLPQSSDPQNQLLWKPD